MARILLVAPTCDGEDVGEAWVGYQWAKHLGDRHDVTLVTYHKRGATPAAEQLPGLRVVEWPEPRGLGRFERFNSMLKPGYIPFYIRARRWIRGALAAGERFDVAHQPVPVAMRYPSPAAGLGVPLVVGPVGGGLADPPQFDSSGETSPWFVRLRALDQWRLRHDPLLRATYTDAACVLGIAPYVGDLLEDVPVRRLEYMSETALTGLPPLDAPPPDDDTCRLLFVGRVIRTKGLRYAIEALARISENVTLDVVGDGPDLAHCRGRVQDLALMDRVRFHGRQPRERVEHFYRSSDIFVFPSFREPGGNVALEAMANRLPLIVCDRGGPGAAVSDEAGILLPVSTEEQLVADLATAIDALAGDRDRREQMGLAARRHVERTGLWVHRADQIDRVFGSLT